MKKILYFILLIAEAFVGTLLMIALFNSTLYIPLAVAVAAVAALLTWQIILFTKATEPLVKKRIMRNIALVMLIPWAVFCITYFIVAIAFIVAFT